MSNYQIYQKRAIFEKLKNMNNNGKVHLKVTMRKFKHFVSAFSNFLESHNFPHFNRFRMKMLRENVSENRETHKKSRNSRFSSDDSQFLLCNRILIIFIYASKGIA